MLGWASDPTTLLTQVFVVIKQPDFKNETNYYHKYESYISL
jgi:hypothetical protein